MKQTLGVVVFGLLALSLGGCADWNWKGLTGPTGKDYWLVYKYNKDTVPAATYQGYYSNETGTVREDEIATCLKEGKLPDAGENCKKGIPGAVAKKPPLTDDDQAQVVVSLNERPPKGLECIIKQTKITRQPFDAYVTDTKTKGLVTPSVYFCDLHLTDAGGMRLDYSVQKQQEEEKTVRTATGASETQTITTKAGVVNDSIEVHTLYRFRVLVGPVYSSISDSKDRTFTAKTHAGGTSYVASDANGNPAHAAAFLKYYWKPRNIYDTKPCFVSKDKLALLIDCLGTINPIVGLGISENPLKNVYVGGSLDILPGLDIVGGVHWSSVQTLSGGFTQGQIVPNGTIIPTEQRFLPGWFVGIAVDTGVAGTWISKATTSLFK